MIRFLFVSLFFQTIVSRLPPPSCRLSEADACLSSALPAFGARFPETSEELTSFCATLESALKCFESYAKRCLSGLQSEISQWLLLQPLTARLATLCRSERNQTLHNAITCFNPNRHAIRACIRDTPRREPCCALERVESCLERVECWAESARVLPIKATLELLCVSRECTSNRIDGPSRDSTLARALDVLLQQK